MNKTIIININGIVFHIEEDAYEILRTYMTEVKRHFAYTPDSDEIVTDIENRLAEMFNERLTQQNKQVIVLSDVQEITAQMGKASDFEINEDGEDPGTEKLRASKTLYKDTEDRMVAGVCAGLGHYFDIEVKWVRLITLLLTLFSGVAVIPYLVLWIVLPTARTRQEKMSMKGEPINLQSFKRNFDQEAESSRLYNTASYNAPYQSVNNNDPIREILVFVGKGLKVVLKLLVGLIIVMACVALFGLVVFLLFGLGFINHAGFQEFPFNAISAESRSPIFFSAFLILIIPLLALILFAIRVLINRKVVFRYGAFAMLILWITGIGMGIYYGAKTVAEFSKEAKLEQVSSLEAFPILTLRLNRNLFLNGEDSLKYNIGPGEVSGRIIYGENNLAEEMQRFDLFIERSDDDKLSLVKELSGRGRTFERALEAAQRITYNVVQKDSVIHFDKFLSLSGNGLYRGQKLDMHLKVPVNTKLIIDRRLNHHVRGHDLWDCSEKGENSGTASEWIMTDQGLKCIKDEPSGLDENEL